MTSGGWRVWYTQGGIGGWYIAWYTPPYIPGWYIAWYTLPTYPGVYSLHASHGTRVCVACMPFLVPGWYMPECLSGTRVYAGMPLRYPGYGARQCYILWENGARSDLNLWENGARSDLNLWEN